MLVHCYVRGVDRQPIYVDERDHRRRLRQVEVGVARFGIAMIAYVSMGNHDHFFLRLREQNLSGFMHYINGEYAKWVNWRHDRTGHLFQGRYGAQIVEEESYIFELSSYIHLNPIRAGIVARPEDHPWSSYAGYVDARRAVPWVRYDFLLSRLAPDPATARQKYRELVERDMARRPPSPWRNIRGGLFLGRDSWVRRTRSQLGMKQSRALGGTSRTIPFPVIVDAVARTTGTTVAALLDARNERASELRPLLVYATHRLGGHSHAAIQSAMGYRSRSAVAYSIRQYEARRARFELAMATLEAELGK